MPTSYKPGQPITVRDIHGKKWSATYKGDNGSRTRAELRNIKRV